MSKKTITVNATNKAVNVKLITLFYSQEKLYNFFNISQNDSKLYCKLTNVIS